MSRGARGNLLGLAVLSCLAEAPMHRYEMARILRARSKDRQLGLSLSSLYTVVDGMERRGLVEATGIERAGRRPERTPYRITSAGRAELADWARDLVANPRPETTALVAGLSAIAALGPGGAIRALESRAEASRSRLARVRDELHAAREHVPRLFLLEDEYAVAALETELAWVDALLGELRDGTFPGLADWRALVDAEGGAMP